MSRKWLSVAMAVGVLGFGAPAAATTFSVVSLVRSWNPAVRGAQIGDTVTIGIRIAGGVGVHGLGASAFGYDESVLGFVSGEAVRSINHAVALPGIGAFDGLPNSLTNPLRETSIGSNGPRVLFFNGISLVPTDSNPLDPGLDGVVGGNDAQARLTFRLTGFGLDVVQIGPGYEGDAEVLAGGAVNKNGGITIFDPFMLVPEPSSALLVALGLAALASGGRVRPRC